MRYVLTPRPDQELFAQDCFVHDLSLFHGLTLVRPGACGYENPPTGLELIVSHNPDDPHDAKYIAAHAGDVAAVVHVHCQFEFFWESRQRNLKKAVPAATIAIVPSRAALSRATHHFPGIDWRHVPNGARKSLYYPSTEAERRNFRTRFHIPAHKKVVGFVGRLDDMKGLQILQGVAEVLDRIGAILFVQYPGWPSGSGSQLMERYRTAASRLEECGANIITYADPGPRLPGRPMRCFDVLLMPSLSEVQPMVALEALASGVPVVATLCSGWFDDLRGLGFQASECALVELPERFQKGATAEKTIVDERELKKVTDDVVKALNGIPPYDDARRLELEEKTARAGYSDQVMYAKFLTLYDEAILSFRREKPEFAEGRDFRSA